MIISNPVARFGEDAAVNYLKKKGYQIIERISARLWRNRYVSVHNNILVFVEVKARTTTLYGGASKR